LVDNASTLQADLNQDQGDTSQNGPGKLPLVNQFGQITMYVTQDRYSAIAAMEYANSVAAGTDFNPAGAFITSWNSSAPRFNPNYEAGVESYLGQAGPTNFYGFTNSKAGNFGPVRRPPPARRPPGRGPM